MRRVENFFTAVAFSGLVAAVLFFGPVVTLYLPPQSFWAFLLLWVLVAGVAGLWLAAGRD